jgi:hypothetical protein
MSFEEGDHVRLDQRPARIVSADTPGAATVTTTSHHGPLALLVDHRNRKQRRAAAAQERAGRANEL